jgi:hypothetical protein
LSVKLESEVNYQLDESDLPVIFQCCIYSERFKRCLTFTEPFMVYSEEVFLCCSNVFMNATKTLSE